MNKAELRQNSDLLFTIFQRLQDQRDESKELLEGQIEEKQQEIEELKSDVLQKDFKIKELSEQAKGFEIEVSYLEKQLDSKEDHINMYVNMVDMQALMHVFDCCLSFNIKGSFIMWPGTYVLWCG